MKALRYILILLVAAAEIFLLFYQGFITEDLTRSNLLKSTLILAGLFFSW